MYVNVFKGMLDRLIDRIGLFMLYNYIQMQLYIP